MPEKTKQKRYCPFHINSYGDMRNCVKEECMLWVTSDEHFNGCTLVAIARELMLIRKNGL